jgi:predicted NAD/FAD-dependent oxidoreductase
MVRRAEAIPVHAVGRYRQAAAFKREQSSGDSPILFCGDHLATATVDGAMASGYAAADALLSRW